jgi:Predicted membrane protein
VTSPRNSKPSPWTAFWQSVARFQAEKVTPWVGLRNALGIALPLAVGAADGAVPSGVVMSTGALNVAFSDNFDPYSRRGRRMFLASVIVAVAVFAGTVSGNAPASAVAIETVWAFAAGLLVALNTTAADIGVMSLVVLVVFAAQPMPPERALSAGLLAFAGGMLQTLLSVALWAFRRYDPERRALADLYLELARSSASPVVATDAPPASAQSVQAQTTLAALGQNHSIEAERYLSLLSQAERIRLSLLMLGRLRIRIHRESEDSSLGGILDRCLTNAAKALGWVGKTLLAEESIAPEPAWLREIHDLAERLREPRADPASPLLAMAHDARVQMDALAGQLSSALDLAGHAIPEGTAAFERRGHSQGACASPGRWRRCART